MAMNPLPPQAYTKETMLKAYAWLQTQADSIKEIATTPDILVSLFLKAKMNGEASLERPSIQNFKAELKNLAGMMGEFETGDHAAPKAHRPLPKAPPEKATPEAPPAGASFSNSSFNLSPEPVPGQSSVDQLDSQSQGMIREVKESFNLSSDNEALRLLISVGYKKVKQLN
jgi:hypothetical protein